ncbi:Hint domain-containing protein [Limobrevibacterium gyesilva]|uniref:Hint domain-containing protein n=1 Tax=Limobrevibacterium gyesilva TaxID=2991712 RepID=A0AA41YWA9_9PROT|nr:Hint domain-containing protein [Limobrevibacterium gyesilva]MCW3477668.1 Hint domain-containing protein [Limobrevibacterium gyesilva]
MTQPASGPRRKRNPRRAAANPAAPAPETIEAPPAQDAESAPPRAPAPARPFPVGGSFIAGTRIAVRRGDTEADCPVEDLRPGDTVLAHAAIGPIELPVHSVTCHRIDVAGHPTPHLATPVRIRAGALGPDMPRRDLVLPAEALLLLRDVNDADADAESAAARLVPAGALVNGAGITREPATGMHTWHIVATAPHGAIRAENTPVGALREPGPPTGLCAPMLLPGPGIMALRAALQARAAAAEPSLPTPPDAAPVEDDPHHPVRLFANGLEIPAEPAAEPGAFDFLLPADTGPVRIASSSGASPAERDTRRLGVCVIGLALDGEAIDLDGPMPGPGFHPSEQNAHHRWRWTNGSAWLVLPPGDAQRRLTVRITDWHLMLLRDRSA